MPHGRRAFVVGAGTAALGVLALASACAAGQERDGPAGAPATGPPRPTGTVLGAADQIPVGGGMIFEVYEVVVTQPTRGDFRGFSAACTHTGCIVTEIADRTINCPCHGSRYHLDGTVAAGPAPRPLDSRAVEIVDGQIVV